MGPKCRLVIGVVADKCVTQPVVTLTTWGSTSPYDKAGFDALAETLRPPIEVQATSGQFPSTAGCDTTWMFTYGPGLAKYLTSGNLKVTVGGCTDMAPFGYDGAPASLSATQGPNACPTVTIAPSDTTPSWTGTDDVNLVIDNTPPGASVGDDRARPLKLALFARRRRHRRRPTRVGVRHTRPRRRRRRPHPPRTYELDLSQIPTPFDAPL